jgi:hypothetical protein
MARTSDEWVLVRVRDALLLGLLTFVFVCAHFVYLTRVGFAERIARDIPPERLTRFLTGQLAVALGVCLVCAAIGLFLSRRYGLPGVGGAADVKRSLRWTLPGAALGAAVVVMLFDVPFRRIAPGFYPREWTWALAAAFSAAFTAEVVGRFGMMTIFAGIVRHVPTANAAQALFVTLVSLRNLVLADTPLGLNGPTVGGFVLGMGGALAAGWVYSRHGLWAVLLGHLVLELVRRGLLAVV